MKLMIWIGCDVGTSSVKIGAFTHGAHLLHQVAKFYDDEVEEVDADNLKKNGYMEQDAEKWFIAFVEALAELLNVLASSKSDVIHVQALAFGGAMQSVVNIGRNGRSLRKAILYSDTRANEEADFLVETVGGVENVGKITTNFKGAASCIAKLIWLDRYEKQLVWDDTEHFVFGSHSYVVYRICGRAWCDATTADTTSLLQRSTKLMWSEELLDRVGLKGLLGKLPTLIENAGEINAKVEFGSIEGLLQLLTENAKASFSSHEPVNLFHGAGDLGTTSLGAFSSQCDGYIYLGTSGWIARTAKPGNERQGVFYIRHPIESESLIEAVPTTSCGANLQWACKNLFHLAEVQAFESFDIDAAKSPSGANGMLFLPHISGERAPLNRPFAKGSFLGIHPESNAHDFKRAVLEGVAFQFRWMKDVLMESKSPESLVIVGGGANSNVWCQIFANVLSCKIVVHKDGNRIISALGAAILCSGKSDMTKPNNEQLIYVPSHTESQKYDTLFDIWKGAFLALDTTHEKLAQLRKTL